MINKEKSKIQLKAVELSRRHKNLCLEWTTGTGKTLAAIKIVEDALSSCIKSNPTGYLICKEKTHVNNWDEEIKKHNKNSLFSNIDKLLYGSAHKYNKVADFIILDECHALTIARLNKIKPLVDKNTKLIFLSATIPDNKRDLMNRLSIGNIFNYKIDLNKAIFLGLLPKPTLIVHSAELDDTGRNIFQARSSKNKKFINCNESEMWDKLKDKRIKSYGINVICSDKSYYKLISNQMDYMYKVSQDIFNVSSKIRTMCRNKYLNLGSKRKNFIAEAKTKKANEIVNKFRSNGERFICFTGSIEQSLLLGATRSVNSKNDSDQNKELIDSFNSEREKELFAVKMLRESVNLTNIEKGIIVQLDSTVGSFYQMLGRSLRYEFPEMHLIVMKNTRDEYYFETAMEDFDKKYIKHES